MSIAEKTESYKRIIKDRWHTPGHKGILWPDDLTEIDEGDFFPGTAIFEAEKVAAKAYGCKELRFLTGGSSMGVKAAILSCGGDILVGSCSHQSVFEGAKLANVKAHIIVNEIKDDLPQPLTVAQIKEGIKDNPNIKAVVIESPNYYGKVCSEEIVKAVKDSGKLLIADSAHGAHFVFNEELFPQSFSKTADFCNLSAHKTLSALTMGAYLCINNVSLIEKANESLKNLGTTSPLYPLLSSLEKAVEIGYLQKNVYNILKAQQTIFSEKVPCYQNDDFTRIVVDARALNLTGKNLYNSLLVKGIAAEKYSDR